VFERLSLAQQFASLTPWALRFLNTNVSISQNSVTTRLGCGWVFKYNFVTKFPTESNGERIFENQLTFGEITENSTVSCFCFDSQCRQAFLLKRDQKYILKTTNLSWTTVTFSSGPMWPIWLKLLGPEISLVRRNSALSKQMLQH